MEDRLRYSASDCFETFPFPADAAFATLDTIGEQFYAVRAHYAALTRQGLTTTYNQLKDPDYAGDLSPASADRPTSPDRTAPPWAMPAGLADALPAITADPDLLEPETRIAYIHDLRRLHEDLDRAVLAAYGWSDIPVPPYCPHAPPTTPPDPPSPYSKTPSSTACSPSTPSAPPRKPPPPAAPPPSRQPAPALPSPAASAPRRRHRTSPLSSTRTPEPPELQDARRRQDHVDNRG